MCFGKWRERMPHTESCIVSEPPKSRLSLKLDILNIPKSGSNEAPKKALVAVMSGGYYSGAEFAVELTSDASSLSSEVARRASELVDTLHNNWLGVVISIHVDLSALFLNWQFRSGMMNQGIVVVYSRYTAIPNKLEIVQALYDN